MKAKLLVLTLLLAGLAYADDPAQSAIQANYDKANTAMRYKYLDGVLGIRAADYRAYNPRGQVINPAEEVRSLEQALSTATYVTETTTITNCVRINDHQLRARIKDVIEFDQPGAPGHPRPPVTVQTIADDTWVLQGKEWKLQTTHVVSQGVDNSNPG